MKVLWLGPERKELINSLEIHGDEFFCYEEKLTLESKILTDIEFIISYGYRHILKEDVLNKFPKKVINLHISLLPWNRGADPNLWSFLENTPKGVTIHYIDPGLDTGEILVQEEIKFNNNETLKTSYEKLTVKIEELLRNNWGEIRTGEIKGRSQPSGGSCHKLKDKEPYLKYLTKIWDTPVKDIIGKAK
jgi:methionyl-tRNA formyltransferase